ncbi:hypothetical protein DM860_011820 [Cuscuta australis]|uniref:Expansin-like EG45 domain-containing protein n=1 Tax=Cuscuta australis TaxID=267555 RepID=A0A328DKF1_9ASTE|nr:hypothetical protein DM860_011820 [Cuscuta australis]
MLGGACGYGEDGRSANNGEVCAVSRRLFKNGAGCGACYHVRCKSKGLCSQEGENVMVTDYAEGHDDVDFVVSYRTFERLARLPRMTDILTSKGFVDIEYQRVSCGGVARNLTVKIHENSQYPHYLSLIVPTNQGGASDILAIEVYEEDKYQWISMRRVYGAVWDLPNPPSGELKLRFLVSREFDAKWVETEKAVIPTEWKAGLIFETSIRVN